MNPTTGGAGCCARAASGQRSDEAAALPSPAMNSRRFTDHLVGGGQKRFWDGKAEGFGGFEVESQLDFYGLLDRQIGWFLALENAPGIDASLVHPIAAAASIAHQAASQGELTVLVDRG